MSCRLQARVAAILVAACAFAAPPAGAQSNGAGGPAVLPRVGAPPPPPPLPPATVARSADGGVSVRAVRIYQPLEIDGRLDEDVYKAVPAISDFIQQDPREGEPATEQTEVWILFDDKNLYVSARCWDSQPEREIANEMRRDGTNILQNEKFGISLDTFYDKRNGFVFYLTPLGGLMDIQFTDESGSNRDWNTIWDVRTGSSRRVDRRDGDPVQVAALPAGPNQVWGINLRRIVRWKNEASYLTRVPAFLAHSGIFRISLGATLVGLEVPSGGLQPRGQAVRHRRRPDRLPGHAADEERPGRRLRVRRQVRADEAA